MKLVDEFRDPDAVRTLAAQIRSAAEGAGRLCFMEVCGGHTMAIHRFGLPDLLPENIELRSGPGCPVCVTPSTYVDRTIEIGREPGTVLCTFGDLYRVPGESASLEDAAAEGVDVRIVYSPRDALKVARNTPDSEVVFLAVGFETTAPTVAATVLEAAADEVGNFRVLSGHKTMPRALRALMEAPDVRLDGFLLPGHVAAIAGPDDYRFLPEEFDVACSVTGFEPMDILLGVLSLVRQVVEEAPRVDNQYKRAVADDGNPVAREVVSRVFEPADSQWRGLGLIPESGLDVRAEWGAFSRQGPDPAVPSSENEACRCTEVLRGQVLPVECPLFGKACVPDSPVGPCMVSSEGACAAFFRYGGADV